MCFVTWTLFEVVFVVIKNFNFFLHNLVYSADLCYTILLLLLLLIRVIFRYKPSGIIYVRATLYFLYEDKN